VPVVRQAARDGARLTLQRNRSGFSAQVVSPVKRGALAPVDLETMKVLGREVDRVIETAASNLYSLDASQKPIRSLMDAGEEQSRPIDGNGDSETPGGEPVSSTFQPGDQLGSEINVEEFTRMLEALQLRFKDIHELMGMAQSALNDMRSLPYGVVAQIPDELNETRESLVSVAERAMAASKHAEVTSALAVVTWARLLKRPIKSLIQDVAKVALSETGETGAEPDSNGTEEGGQTK